MSDDDIWGQLETPNVRDRLNQARKIRDQMGIYGDSGQSSREFLEFSPAHTQGIMEWCFGMIWNQRVLELKTREIVVLSTMVAQDLPDELAWHVRAGLNLGLTREEIVEVVVQCGPYVGLPKTNHALKAVMKVFKELDAEKAA